MHDYGLILTLTGGLGAALLLGYVTQRLGLSPIAGYLLAGTLVGPHTPGFVADSSLAEQLAEVGVILLMFGVGLQFHVEELLAVRRIAIPGAVAQSAVATGLGALLAVALGWSWPAGIVFGMALAVASTVVLIRILSDHNDLHTQAGHIAVGWLVVEDLFTVLALVLLPALFGAAASSAVGGSLGLTLAITTMKVVALVAVASSVIFSVSMALGAFVAGLIVGRSDYSLRAASEALPMRDAFAVLFFVSVGMLLDPRALLASPALVAGALAIVLVGKPLVAILLVGVMGYPLRTALTVGVALAQIGEFSFILATMGRELGLLTGEATNALVATAIVSIVLNPLAYRATRPVERWLLSRPTVARLLARRATSRVEGTNERPPAAAETDPAHRAVVIGYGPTGRTVVRLLLDNQIAPTVVELNMDAVRELRDQGVDAVYGDATRPETLQAAGLDRAGSVILGSAGMASSAEVIRLARQMNPDVRVLARAAYLRDVHALRRAGATSVYSGEAEVALALVEDILDHLGATPEQMERERARAHHELAGHA